MNTSLDGLFVRYWENDLSEADAAEFEFSSSDRGPCMPREEFQLFCLQAVVASELPLAVEAAETPQNFQQPEQNMPGARWSRRRLLRYIGGSAAAIAIAGVFGRQRWVTQSEAVTGVRISELKGQVTLRMPSGQSIRPSGDIPAGSTLAIIGPISSAVLSCQDGTEVSFTGDTDVAVMSGGSRLVLLRGTATADIPAHRVGPDSMILQTAHASLARLSDVLLTMARTQRGTEVGVQNGVVAVDSPNGRSLGFVRAGEILTVRADGDRSKQLKPTTPDNFAWDLGRPLPSGWNVGQREETADGPVVVPEFWLDPYYQVEMCQIRSDQQWARGFFALYPDSIGHSSPVLESTLPWDEPAG